MNTQYNTKSRYNIVIQLDNDGNIILAEQKCGNLEVTYTKENKAKITLYGKGGKEINRLVTSKKSVLTYMKIVTRLTDIYDEVGRRIKTNNLSKTKTFIRKYLIKLKYKISDILDKYF
jgi:dissimilatory sulfite reductase (desulfoviridin) alpha/beta subunit